jgi:NAD+ kinase
VWLEARGHAATYGTEAYDSDFLVVLGGDGTMLRAAKQAAKCGTPMLGINLGNLGYLTDVDRDEGFAAMEKMIKGQFRREQRMMLSASSASNGQTSSIQLALNEVFIRGRGDSAGLVSYRICAAGGHLDTVRADGVIIATPTGSTAYSLSAGGPILKPDSEMIVITAVCPHTLYARPWVLSGDEQVSISPQNYAANVLLDGEHKFTLERGEVITINRSEHRATVLKTANMDFFEILRKKMRSKEV